MVQPTSIERGGSYMRAIKNLLLAMASDALPSDMEVRETSKDIQLWSGTRLQLVRTYVGSAITGDKYLLTNVSKKSMTVNEQELYTAGVLAVSLENLDLAPGDASNLFVIRERGRHE